MNGPNGVKNPMGLWNYKVFSELLGLCDGRLADGKLSQEELLRIP